jgi:hypothetical protein
VEERRPEAARPVVWARALEIAQAFAEIEEVGIWPIEGLDVGLGLRAGQGAGLAVRFLAGMDVEDLFALRMPVRRIPVLRSDPAEIVAQLPA